MSLYRLDAGADGESHREAIHVAQHPALGALRQVAQVGIQVFPALRTMDFHRLPERRLILHVRGEVEIGVSDGRTQIFRPSDAQLMEDTSGRGATPIAT
jgi:hypothetical protein